MTTSSNKKFNKKTVQDLIIESIKTIFPTFKVELKKIKLYGRLKQVIDIEDGGFLVVREHEKSKLLYIVDHYRKAGNWNNIFVINYAISDYEKSLLVYNIGKIMESISFELVINKGKTIKFFE